MRGVFFMASKNAAQNALCKKLGKDYRIYYIDLERCIYRDFGNGFNVEISGTHTTNKRKPASLYLWFGSELIVKRVHDVHQDDIGHVADELYAYSQQLLEQGYTTWDDLFYLLNPELRKHRTA